MMHRPLPLALVAVVVLTLAGCSGSSSKATVGTTTIKGSTTTVPASRSTTTRAPAAVTAPLAVPPIVPASADPPSSATNAVAPASTSARRVTTTTATGRVVSKPNDNVQLGDSGAGVKSIQAALVAQGYKVKVDGDFGAKTEAAVKAFQAKGGLKQDGIVGPATWKKLQAAPATTTTTAKP